MDEFPEIDTPQANPWDNAPEDTVYYERIYEDGHLGSFTESAELACALGWFNNRIAKDAIQQSDINGWTYIKEQCPMKSDKDIQKEEYSAEIQALKKQLADTDYRAIKFAEGVMTDEDYQATGIQRQAWRRRINELEAMINDDN